MTREQALDEAVRCRWWLAIEAVRKNAIPQNSLEFNASLDRNVREVHAEFRRLMGAE